MKVRVEESIDAAPERVWALVTDIENSAEVIGGIQKLEVLERPAQGLLGLKWRETRVLFGKEATEVMWVTDVDEGRSYQVAAESHGMRYQTRMQVEPEAASTRLSMEFSGEPQTFGARVMGALLGRFFVGATRKALAQDLADIKRAAEAG